ncbi:unnamed protein product [Vitrella brassicaformis CCMP3155]|uniref:UVR domain-containing protein n=2 Tax=Vitrella brassicaformis TaxID=1169539 RepID=A0A0G4FC01_VITBC|nr:unnamed protein product [Vitrella brassicaformis CCMP3155]|eukprot:CEM10726.1 unnamed protein product [Vitrella brassicaformis CCMP3155]
MQDPSADNTSESATPEASPAESSGGSAAGFLFSGLSLSHKKPTADAAPPSSSSAFSFVAPTAAEQPPPPTPAPEKDKTVGRQSLISSAFSFLSGAGGSEANGRTDTPADGEAEGAGQDHPPPAPAAVSASASDSRGDERPSPFSFATAATIAARPTPAADGVIPQTHPHATDTRRKKTRRANLPGYAARAPHSQPPSLPPSLPSSQPPSLPSTSPQLHPEPPPSAASTHTLDTSSVKSDDRGDQGGGAGGRPPPPPPPRVASMSVTPLTFTHSRPQPPQHPSPMSSPSLSAAVPPEQQQQQQVKPTAVKPAVVPPSESTSQQSEPPPTPPPPPPPPPPSITSRTSSPTASPLPREEGTESGSWGGGGGGRAREVEQEATLAGVQYWMQARTARSLKAHQDLIQQQQQQAMRNHTLTQEIATLKEQVGQTEVEQNRLVEEEQFEEAEKLDAKIIDIKAKVAAKLDSMASASEAQQRIASQLLEITEAQLKLTERAQSRLKELLVQEEADLSTQGGRDEERLAGEAHRIQVEEQRIAMARGHIERDHTHSQEEIAQVEAAIDSQTGDHRKERDDAAEQKRTVDAEIIELERQLAEKRAHQKQLGEVIEACDIRIHAIRSKFEKQLHRIQDNERRILEAKEDLKADEAQLEHQKAALENDRAMSKKNLQRLESDLERLRSEGLSMCKRASHLSTHLQHRRRWLSQGAKHQMELAAVRSKVEQSTAEAQKLAAALSKQEALSTNLRSQLSTITARLPILDAEKKVAVSQRAFKEAGRITNEIKSLEEEQQRIQTELAGLGDDIESLREHLRSCREREERAQSELAEAEERADRLEIEVTKKRWSGLLSLIRTSPDPLEKQTLEAEVDVCRTTIRLLAEKYNMTDEGTPSEHDRTPSPSSHSPQHGGSRVDVLMEETHAEEADTEEKDKEGEAEEGKESKEQQQPAPPAPSPAEAPAAAAAAGEEGEKTDAEGGAVVDWDEVKRRRGEIEAAIAERERSVAEHEGRLEEAVAGEDFDAAAEIDEQISDIKTELERLREELAAVPSPASPVAQPPPPPPPPPPDDTHTQPAQTNHPETGEEGEHQATEAAAAKAAAAAEEEQPAESCNGQPREQPANDEALEVSPDAGGQDDDDNEQEGGGGEEGGVPTSKA